MPCLQQTKFLPKTIFLGLSFLALFSVDQTVSADELVSCSNLEWGYSIDCDTQWATEIEPLQEKFIIDNQPQTLATLTVTVAPNSQLKIEDLTPPLLQRTFGYDKSFKMGKVWIGKERGLFVEAISVSNPQIKFMDFFAIKNKNLFRISFATERTKGYARYRNLFKKLISSFQWTTYQ